MNLKSKQIFISKNLSEKSCISTWLRQKNHKFISKRLIDTVSLKQKIPQSEWVFFVSKSAIDAYFFNQGNKDLKFAVLSQVTQSHLLDYGVEADFVGKTNNTEDIAHDFVLNLNDETVFFPIGNLSKKNISNKIPLSQLKMSVLYQTILKPQKFDVKFDILIFTSSSNVDAYFKYNLFFSNQQIIAIGSSTGDYIKEKLQINSIEIASNFSEEAILEALIQQIIL